MPDDMFVGWEEQQQGRERTLSRLVAQTRTSVLMMIDGTGTVFGVALVNIRNSYLYVYDLRFTKNLDRVARDKAMKKKKDGSLSKVDSRKYNIHYRLFCTSRHAAFSNDRCCCSASYRYVTMATAPFIKE